MKKFLQFFGTVIYSLIISYFTWLLFYNLVPSIMAASWWQMFLYLFIGSIIVFEIGTLIGSIFIVPSIFLMKNNNAAKIINLLICGFGAFATAALPFNLDIDFGFKEWVIIISFWSIVIPFYLSIIIAPFGVEDR